MCNPDLLTFNITVLLLHAIASVTTTPNLVSGNVCYEVGVYIGYSKRQSIIIYIDFKR